MGLAEDDAEDGNGDCRDTCSGRKGNNPGQTNRLHQVPVSGTVNDTDTENGTNQNVGGGNRQTQQGSNHNDYSSGKLCGKTRCWVDLSQAGSDGLDNEAADKPQTGDESDTHGGS